MKAEHRKELHTNTLAAGMGRLAQRMKTRPQRRTVLWVVLGVAVVGILVAWWWIHGNRVKQDAERWYRAYNLDDKNWQVLSRDWPNTKPGIAARYQVAWILLWEEGIKRLGSNPTMALDSIKTAQAHYKRLAEEAKDDKNLSAEAEYNVALAQESLAVRDPKNLTEAIPLYKRVVQDHGGTAWASQAKARLEVLEDRSRREEVERVYQMVGLPGLGFPFDLQEHLRKMGKGKLPPEFGGGP